MEAYILVKISTQKSLRICSVGRGKLMMLKGVENAKLLFGDYDVLGKLNAPKTHDVENLVIEEISRSKASNPQSHFYALMKES